MKVLVLSGEVTHQRPISYGFPSDWEISVLSLIDAEYLTLCEKFGDAKSIYSAETVTFLKRAYERTVDHINDHDVDVIVGIGYGAHVLMNLNTSHEWRDPSVFILTEGNVRYNFAPRPLHDEIDYEVRPIKSALITIASKETKNNSQRQGTQSRKSPHERAEILQIVLREEDWQDNLYGMGLLASSVKILVQ